MAPARRNRAYAIAIVALGLLVPSAPLLAAPDGIPEIDEVIAEIRSDDEQGDLPPVVERPDFMRNKPTLPDFMLRNKREGRYFTGIPAIGWDEEEGVTLGAFIELFDNGSKNDPFFRSTAYRQKIFFGGVASSEKVIRVLARLDSPYIFESPYRLRIDALFTNNPIRNYFGIGEDGLQDLNYPGAADSFDSFDRYQDALNDVIPNGEPILADGSEVCPFFACTYARYNRYLSRDVFGVVSIERDLMGGLLRPLVGFQLNFSHIEDYTGDEIDPQGGGGDAIQLPTKFREDCDAGIISGCGGGWDNFLKLGLTYDSRDFEPDPTDGVLAEAVAEIASEYVGAISNYQRLTFSGGIFQNLLRREGALVIATRALYNMQFGRVPSWSLPTHAFNSRDRNGLGGFDTLRGYRRQRFVGNSTVLINAELRWSITEWNFLGQHLKPGLAPFFDAGRSFDDIDLKFKDWKYAIGIGFRLAWNLATVISFDYGVSPEDQIFYIELGTQL